MSIGAFIKKKAAKIVTFPVLNKEKRRSLRKKLELKWGCADTGVLNVYFDSVMRKYNGLVENAPEIETLVSGDSHAQFGCAPFVMGGNAYNCAFNANSLYESFEVVKRAAEMCPRLKTVVLFVSFYNGGYSLVRTTEAWRCRILEKYLKIPFDFSVNKTIDVRLYDAAIEKLRLSGDNLCCQGFDFAGQHINRSTKKTRDRVLHHFKIYQKYDNQWSVLRDFCDFCKEKGLRPLLVYPPVRTDYAAVLNEVGQGFDPTAVVKQIAAEKGVALLDARDGFDDDDFADADHLNFNGAVKLTRRITGAL